MYQNFDNMGALCKYDCENENIQFKQIENVIWRKYENRQINKSYCTEKWPNWGKGVRGLQ